VRSRSDEPSMLRERVDTFTNPEPESTPQDNSTPRCSTLRNSGSTSKSAPRSRRHPEPFFGKIGRMARAGRSRASRAEIVRCWPVHHVERSAGRLLGRPASGSGTLYRGDWARAQCRPWFWPSGTVRQFSPGAHWQPTHAASRRAQSPGWENPLPEGRKFSGSRSGVGSGRTPANLS
jgi:hypothetical protein